MNITNKHTSIFASLPIILSAGIVTASVGAAAPAAAAGHDYIDEARLLYNVVACADPGSHKTALSKRVIKTHCRELAAPVKRFKKRYVERAARFLAKRRPAGLPTTVVYPFGGGDLISALVTYPDAVDITTRSLEHAGDPRRLSQLGAQQLDERLLLFRDTVKGLLNLHDSTSKNLRKMEKGPLPGQLSFFLLGLAVSDYEPVSVKFFRVEPDGSLHYYEKAEVDALDDTLATKKERRWVDTDYSVAFSNVEITFRPVGNASAPVRVHRHIAANLDNEHYKDSGIEKYLTAKGRIVAMTKAASYLLWMKDFSEIRGYLLDHMEFMFSDSTGIPPVYAKRKGFEQRTYGVFKGSFLPAAKVHNEAFLELWESQPQRGLPFRYGYTDSEDNYHMMITRPKRGKKRNKKR